MADETPGGATAPKSKDEVALELMKFISVTTGFGKGVASAGFSGHGARNPEEHADALLDLFQRCRAAVHKAPPKE